MGNLLEEIPYPPHVGDLVIIYREEGNCFGKIAEVERTGAFPFISVQLNDSLLSRIGFAIGSYGSRWRYASASDTAVSNQEAKR